MSIERIKKASEQILSRLANVRGKGEQATKQALVLPLIDALEYDIWNPSEVCPEYEADFAIKKTGQKEKVDIAILIKGEPAIYIETKSIDESLDGHEGQLARYFNSTPRVCLGVLTNGIEWRFFTDTSEDNVMDKKPFHVSRLDSVDQGLDVLARFSKSVFCPEAIGDFATELLYTEKIAFFLRKELDLKDQDPSEHFVRWILKSENMYDGVVNANVIERFNPIIKTALTKVVREIVRRSITAMDEEAARQSAHASGVQAPQSPEMVAPLAPTTDGAVQELAGEDDGKSKIVTTDDELKAFAIIKGIFEASEEAKSLIFDPSQRKDVPVSLAYKDTTGYFGIYLNKPSWWAMRLQLDGKTKWIGFNLDDAAFNSLPPEMIKLEASAFARCRIKIETVDAIEGLKDVILGSIRKTLQDRKA